MFRQNPIRTIWRATALVTLIGVAGAFGSPLAAQAAPDKSAVFEVGARGSGTSDTLWCGAAKYTRRYLDAGWKDTIYLVRGRGGGAAKGLSATAQFTLDPAAAGVTPLADGATMDPLAVGYNMSVQRANMLCSMPPPGR